MKHFTELFLDHLLNVRQIKFAVIGVAVYLSLAYSGYGEVPQSKQIGAALMSGLTFFSPALVSAYFHIAADESDWRKAQARVSMKKHLVVYGIHSPLVLLVVWLLQLPSWVYFFMLAFIVGTFYWDVWRLNRDNPHTPKKSR
ncbi:hypothetical protein MXMO3_02491 [Maritalea myrionectae]|uniref:Uncharacterized protein n=1 Tax=Maritalea myrionectae TaxID=454601 RepID=A0A2R4MGB4_9HYPH|nr:hypothetical protein [Maritalea myrionectae]AVX05003.1 hypothetical protein MXMO3_02491 [Maritalea myrionectae]